MNLYRLTKRKYAEDISGEGAQLFGGRWNQVGTPCIYTSTSVSLSLCEYFVNLPSNLLPSDIMLVTIDLEEKYVLKIDDKTLPEEWDRLPISTASQIFGNKYLEDTEIVAFSVPSVIVSMERNIVINPQSVHFHDAFHILSKQEFKLDNRFEK